MGLFVRSLSGGVCCIVVVSVGFEEGCQSQDK